jgi:hypothetical protein
VIPSQVGSALRPRQTCSIPTRLTTRRLHLNHFESGWRQPPRWLPTDVPGELGDAVLYGVRHTKFAASSILPEPVYLATCG